MEIEPDVIVVGGGIAGLIAALEAARAGASVELHESHGSVGGRAGTRSVAGFRFNQGAHAFYLKGAFGQALDRLQVNVTGAAPNFQSALAVVGERMELIPFSPTAIARTGLLDDRERQAMASSIRALLGDVAPEPGESVARFLDRIGAVGTVRAVLEALVRLTTYCHAPERFDAVAAVRQVQLGFKGVIYVDNGWSALVDALCRAAGAAGVDIRTASAAALVEPAGDGVVTRFYDGGARRSQTVVLA
ncbi:MAG: FAD-dependent oxidoreductase, partial [Stellaceae bacterium]